MQLLFRYYHVLVVHVCYQSYFCIHCKYVPAIFDIPNKLSSEIISDGQSRKTKNKLQVNKKPLRK